MKKKLIPILAIILILAIGVATTIAIVSSRPKEPLEPVDSDPTTIHSQTQDQPNTTTAPITDLTGKPPVHTTNVHTTNTNPDKTTAEIPQPPPSTVITNPGTTTKPPVPTTTKPPVNPPVVCQHTYKDSVTKATCTAAGYTSHTCTLCGHTYTDSETKALGHSYKDTVTAATCTAAGSTKHTCTRCGDSYTSDKIAALGHSWKKGTTVEPTATAQGYTNYTCDRCKQTKKDDYTDPISESGCKHEWELRSTLAPNENRPGIKSYRCTKCDARKTEEFGEPLGKFTGCDNPKHSCQSWEDHYTITAREKGGCPWCGKHDCPCIYAYSTTPGQHGYYFANELCPEYDEHKDSNKYCQKCHMPIGVGLDKCSGLIQDGYCTRCGEYLKAWECHHCSEPLGDKYVPYVYEFCIYCGELYTNGSDEHRKTCSGQSKSINCYGLIQDNCYDEQAVCTRSGRNKDD